MRQTRNINDWINSNSNFKKIIETQIVNNSNLFIQTVKKEGGAILHKVERYSDIDVSKELIVGVNICYGVG